MDLKTITDRIVARADADLKSRISEARKPLDHIIRDGCRHFIKVTTEGGSQELNVSWVNALDALEELAFELRCEKNRQEAIDEFMAKVQSLSEEVHQLEQYTHEH